MLRPRSQMPALQDAGWSGVLSDAWSYTFSRHRSLRCPHRRLKHGRVRHSARSNRFSVRVLTTCHCTDRVYVLKHLTDPKGNGADKDGAIRRSWQGGYGPATDPVTEFRTAWHDGFGRSDREDRVGVSAPSEAKASWSSGGGTQVPRPALKRWLPVRFGEPTLRRREAGRLDAKLPQGNAAPR